MGTLSVFLLILCPVLLSLFINLLTGGKIIALKKSTSIGLLLGIISVIALLTVLTVIEKNKAKLSENKTTAETIKLDTPAHGGVGIPSSPINKEIDRNLPIERKQEQNRPLVTKVAESFMSDYLITTGNENQLQDLVYEVQNLIEEEGASVTTKFLENTSFNNLKGKYKKLIIVTSRIESKSTSIDASAISTRLSYTVKLYELTDDSETLLKSVSDSVPVVGFSESENIEILKQKILPKLKTIL